MSTARVTNVIKEPLDQELEQLFHEHYPMVYRTAYSVTGSEPNSFFLQSLEFE